MAFSQAASQSVGLRCTSLAGQAIIAVASILTPGRNAGHTNRSVCSDMTFVFLPRLGAKALSGPFMLELSTKRASAVGCRETIHPPSSGTDAMVSSGTDAMLYVLQIL